MNTRIKTNQLNYSIDRLLIASDYDFFVIETSEKYIKGGAYILDAPSLDKNIKSILFESGRRAIIMMQHDERNRIVLRKILKTIDGGEKLSVADRRCDSIPDNQLLQLFLDNLASYDSAILKSNNLTGHFYCFHPNWLKHGKDKGEDIVWKIPCLELSITKDCVLKAEVRTFTNIRLKKRIGFGKKKFEDYPQYVFSKRQTLRRKLADDKDSAFILRQVDGGKTEIPFLDFQNSKKFEECKVGMVSKIMQTFNEKYGPLAHLDFGYEEISQRIDYCKAVAKENAEVIRQHLVNLGVHIVDQIGDEYSAMFCQDIAELVGAKYGCTASIGKRIKKDSLNICIIHNREYYEGASDPHDKMYPGIAVQHITLDDFAGSADFALSTVIHEVLIKHDLTLGRITLFDWPSLAIDEEISFGVEAEVDDVNRYFFMKIHPDGSFSMKEQELNLFELTEYSDCVNVFEDARTKSENVKGIIRDSEGRINVIKDTGVITLPEAEEIKTLLDRSDTKLRGKKRREQLLSSCLDIKTYEKEGKLYYFVGTIGEGMRWIIPRAANVRCVEKYEDAPLMFDRLLPTMSVTFVRNGQLTVVPFPFKFLREFILQINGTAKAMGPCPVK